SKLNLDSLESGFDSIQLRVWYFYAFQSTKKVFVLKNDKGRWGAELYSYIETSDSIIGEIHKLSNISLNPKTSFSNLWKQATSFDITELPNYRKVGIQGGEDGALFAFEIASKQSYRFFLYPDPKYNKDKSVYANNVYHILMFLNKEFDI